MLFKQKIAGTFSIQLGPLRNALFIYHASGAGIFFSLTSLQNY